MPLRKAVGNLRILEILNLEFMSSILHERSFELLRDLENSKSGDKFYPKKR